MDSFDETKHPFVTQMEPGVVYNIEHKRPKRTAEESEEIIRSLKKSVFRSGILNILLLAILLGVTAFACIKFNMLIASYEELSRKYDESWAAREEAIAEFSEFNYLTSTNAVIEIPITDYVPMAITPNEIGIPQAPVYDEELYVDIPLDTELKEYIFNSAIVGNIPPEIMFGLAWTESRYNPDAVSSTNDYGLFQINQCNFESLADHFGYTSSEFQNKIMDPYVNTDCAVYFLVNLRNTYSDDTWHQTLMRYNMGPSGAQEAFNSGRFSTDYSISVIDYAETCFSYTEVSK